MPKIDQLPPAPSVASTDRVPVAQSDGTARSFTLVELFANSNNLGLGSLAKLSKLDTLDSSLTNVQASGQTVTFGLGARFSDRVDLRAYLAAAGNDFGAALQAAAADVPATGGVIYIAPGAYAAASAAVINANKDICLYCYGRGQALITVNHTGQAITINQDTSGRITHVQGLTFFGGSSVAGPIAGAVKIAYGATAAADVPQQVTIEDVDVFPSLAGAGFSAPYPGSWTAGITLQGAGTGLSGLLGQVRINRYNCQCSLVAGPSPTGSAALVIARVDDIRVTDFSAWYCDSAILQADYCEGLRIDGVTAVGCNHFLTQSAGATAQNNILLQKLWLDDFEINTYSVGLLVSLVTNSFFGAGEFVRYGDSGAGNWSAIDATDCYNWCAGASVQFDGLAGTQTNTIAVRFRYNAALGTGVYCGIHAFIGCTFERVAIGVQLDSGVVNSRFENLLLYGVSGAVLAGVDNSGNGTNRITFVTEGGGLGIVEGSHQLCNSAGTAILSAANTPNAANGVTVFGATAGSAPVIETSGSDTNISMQLAAKGTGAFIANNGDGTLFEAYQGDTTATHFVKVSAVGSGNAPTISPDGTDANINLQIQAKGTGIVYHESSSVFAQPVGVPYIETSQVSGATYTAPSGSSHVILSNGAIAALTFNFPPSPIDGQVFVLTSLFGVTTITWPSGTIEPPSGLAAGKTASFKYLSGSSGWLSLSSA